ncbi:hypothetical protein OO7_02271 [Providencia sneebia DSM 19967]|uniref:Type III secretion system protein n=2 Tax=Providencia sneebia TaxID=516075 RepID=K8WK28_9GAMM|nr:hypothetical protein OO7_02271 [Providencia sneebia DSM 19967]
MSEEIQPTMKQTAIENVLIKHQSKIAKLYTKKIIEQSKKRIKNQYKQAQKELEHIHHIAYQQGYNDGLKKLVIDMIKCIEMSEKHYQSQREQVHKNLLQLLSEIFHDTKLQKIIAEYFVQKSIEVNQKIIYLPEKLKSFFCAEDPYIQYKFHQHSEITMEMDNEVIQFSPSNSASYLLPYVLNSPTHCDLLSEQKLAYQKLLESINNKEQKYDNND